MKLTTSGLKDAKDYLLGQIDQALAVAPTASELGITYDRRGKIDWFRCKVTESVHILFKTSLTSYKVLNFKERLTEFRGEIERSAGYKPVRAKAVARASLSGQASDSTIREMLEDGDLIAAYELARLAGKPLIFSVNPTKDGVWTYGEAKPLAIKGFEDLKMVSARHLYTGGAAASGRSGSWVIIEVATGCILSSNAATKRHYAEGACVRSFTKLHQGEILEALGVGYSQEHLEKQWLVWAELEESK
jgi:hypothetical protein